jgi:hypothetical protein
MNELENVEAPFFADLRAEERSALTEIERWVGTVSERDFKKGVCRPTPLNAKGRNWYLCARLFNIPRHSPSTIFSAWVRSHIQVATTIAFVDNGIRPLTSRTSLGQNDKLILISITGEGGTAPLVDLSSVVESFDPGMFDSDGYVAA